MSVISKEIVEVTPYSGHFRGRFKYTFSDGRITIRRHIALLDSTTSVDQALIDLEVSAIKQMVRIDLNEAIKGDLPIASYKEASLLQVARQYLKNAMQEDDPEVAYKKLKKANDYIVAQGWTPSQIRAQLNLTSGQWNAIKNRFNYLDARAADLTAYDTAKAGDTIREDL